MLSLKSLLAAASVIGLIATPAAAQDTGGTSSQNEERDPQREEIVITGHYVAGLDVLAGTSTIESEALQRNMEVQIGDALTSLPGVSATSFSPGASRPVLRGYQGTRIRVLNDGLGAIDVSNTSADHAVTIDPLTAEKVEVLRGPAVLLFGSEAIGGAVNVITHRLPRSQPEGGFHVDSLARYSSADEGVAGGVALDAGIGENFAVHIDGSKTSTQNLSVGGFVLAPSLRSELRALAAEAIAEGEPDEAAEALEAANRSGVLPNSETDQETAAIGLAYLGDRVELGVSASLFDTRYGVPSRPGTEHHHDGAGGEEEEGPVSIDMHQNRLDLRGRVYLGGWFDHVDARYGKADYEHVEYEGDEVGTRFLSNGSEGRVELHQADRGGWNGTFGGQFYERDFDAIGAEAFVPVNRTEQWGLFVRQDYQPDKLGIEAAVRLENNDISSQQVAFSRQFETVSGALGMRYDITDALRLGVNLSRTARAPSAEELLSDGPHVATQAYELGDPDLAEEKAWGGEVYARYASLTTAANLTFWTNRFDDFIYDADTGAIEDGLPVYAYAQQDAKWWGVELEAATTFLDNGSLVLKGDAVADYIRATLDDGSPVPRIPPLRLGLGLEARTGHFDIRMEGEYSARQDRVSAFETPTDDHFLLGASLGWHPFSRDNESVIMLQAKNLLDVDVRRHASFTKDFVPLAGRDIRLSVRYSF